MKLNRLYLILKELLLQYSRIPERAIGEPPNSNAEIEREEKKRRLIHKAHERNIDDDE